MQQRRAHTTHRCLRKPDLLWCMDTHPIIRPGVLFYLFIYLLLEENVIPIMIFPLTSTPLWLPPSLPPSSPPSSLLCNPYVASEAKQIQA